MRGIDYTLLTGLILVLLLFASGLVYGVVNGGLTYCLRIGGS
jgi:hypothetical protein